MGEPIGVDPRGSDYRTDVIDYTAEPVQKPEYQSTTEEQPETADSGDAGGLIGGIIQGVTNIGSIFAQYHWANKELQRIGKYRKEDLARYRREYADAMKQQGINNVYAEQGIELAQNQFDWGKKTWGAQFALSKDQYNDSREDFQVQMRKNGYDSLMGQMNVLAAKDGHFKNEILARSGV